MGTKKSRGRAAWLVTRHWIADYPRWEIAAIFSARLGGVRVREFVELLSVTSYYTLHEQLDMQWPQHGRVAYPAQFGKTKEGDAWEDEILCGCDPYLRARRVDDLIVERDADGEEKAVWNERPRGSSAWMHPEKSSHE
jgi:hypothetical protein